MAKQQEAVTLQVVVLAWRDPEDDDDLGFVRAVADDVSAILDDAFGPVGSDNNGFEAVECSPVGYVT